MKTSKKICNICKKEYLPTSNIQKRCIDCRARICKFCKNIFNVKDSQWKRKFCSLTCKFNSVKGIYPVNLKGKRGVKPRTYHLRKRPKHAGAEYQEWRMCVFKRDDFTCQICFQKGVRLNADHIKPYAKYPELRLDLSNGRTLCIDCHKKTDSYGWKNYWNNYKSKIARERLASTTKMMF